MTDFALTRPLAIGEQLTQEEVENVFDTNFGYQFKGITLRTPDKGDYIILLANEGALYDDDLGQDVEFTYEGEGVPEKGDQNKQGPNESLINAIEDLIPIYLFISEDGVDEYEYRGIVDVEDYEYVSDGQRMVYRFTMKRLGVDSWEDYKQAEQRLEKQMGAEPSLTANNESFTTQEKRVRSSVFSRNVKQQYDYSCAVCGARRFTPEGNPEVEAAHIYPKSENGDDDLRNGLALCKLHHWAFDSGWFSLTDDHELIVQQTAEESVPEGVSKFEGRTISKPKTDAATPDPTYLAAHRRLHGFE